MQVFSHINIRFCNFGETYQAMACLIIYDVMHKVVKNFSKKSTNYTNTNVFMTKLIWQDIILVPITVRK